MKTPETPKSAAERSSEQPRNYTELITKAKQAGERLKTLKEQSASTAELKEAEKEAATWLNTAMTAKLASTIEAEQSKPARYEMVA